ncbi:hypothetical protein A3A64_00660 [Candidatus Gottesmanbacteria bacterium RIFCSPLOWO2_01_FULL_48_11]|uniref:Cupredoxin family domain protein n=3 Tax=Candidatus Gottesmaniibacteriota TaxID=1752720 RepID=A0A0G1WZE3_9BACT|nr:MAG: Cupredoxin family domain protein [Candidatus Gottesmanbacteria bacterium GW2011_GWA2_47_9]KKU95668.1 MAG: Cupredoxin family domain protein [Candidatus Gottesmanbacteria bacterium GW2011_GWA1_48_13]OGG28236.1 MAG: hypothetical protein A3A64_00660 [Candidatus Gottesmanbacteria bacterium RIFCSPLOWO2_01_FULL_48_11]
MEKIIVSTIGITLIAAIYWFFFGKKEEAMDAKNNWDITVDGGYKPTTIKLFKDKPATLTFTRTDPTACLEEIVFPDYKIKEFLPLNKPVTITLPPPHKPSGFHCGMNMYHGRIDVA